MDLGRGPGRVIGETIFRWLATGSGLAILVILAAVATFLTGLAIPALLSDPADLQFGRDRGFWNYAAPFAFGTVWAAALAMLMAVPASLGIALYLTHYAPRRLAGLFGYVIDLLAAVPSVVFGLWGIAVLAPGMRPIFAWLEEHLGWIPLFARPVSGTGRTMLTAALVLAVMVVPIITALAREVFNQTPQLDEEASLALGATKWEMIRQAVLPFGRAGIISACMLGLGRALGETMAVAMVLSGSSVITLELLTSRNPNTIAANIAQSFPESYGIGRNELIATGLLLFIITLVVNVAARAIIDRRSDFSGAH